MSNIDKRSVQAVADLKAGYTLGHADVEILNDLARIALASLKAEPVAWLLSGGGAKNNVSFDSSNAYADPLREVTPLYTAPPAPVSDSLLSELLGIAKRAADEADECAHAEFSDDSMKHSAAIFDWERRAAMLQGAEPVSQHDELPLDYLQGQKDGLEWAARLAEANHPQTADWLYDDPLELAKAIRKGPDIPEAAGNSPVILDGWVACSERMPEKMVSVLATGDWFDYAVTAWDGKEWLDFDDYEPPVTHWMPLPAAPQQEVK